MLTRLTPFQTHCHTENMIPGIDPGTSGLAVRNTKPQRRPSKNKWKDILLLRMNI
jgi:hypothetical protein